MTTSKREHPTMNLTFPGGYEIVEDASIPPNELHFRDPASGRLLGKIVNIGEGESVMREPTTAEAPVSPAVEQALDRFGHAAYDLFLVDAADGPDDQWRHAEYAAAQRALIAAIEQAARADAKTEFDIGTGYHRRWQRAEDRIGRLLAYITRLENHRMRQARPGVIPTPTEMFFVLEYDRRVCGITDTDLDATADHATEDDDASL